MATAASIVKPLTAYVSTETAHKSTEELWLGRRHVFMAACAVRLLASWQDSTATVAYILPTVTSELVHNTMPICLPIGSMV